MPLTPFLDSQEVAALLKISTKVLRRMARNKEIPAFLLNGNWRFSQDALDRWMQAQAGLDAAPAPSRRGRKRKDYSGLYRAYEHRAHLTPQ